MQEELTEIKEKGFKKKESLETVIKLKEEFENEYREVFKNIFIQMGHPEHYKMMMGELQPHK